MAPDKPSRDAESPYRATDATQHLRERYIRALDEAEHEWKVRERIMNVFMLYPGLIGALQFLKDDVSLTGVLLLILLSNGLPTLYRAKLVDLEKELLKGIRERVNRISTDRHDSKESVKDENRDITNGLTSNEGAIAGPYMITACSTGVYWMFSAPMERVNSSFIFWSGMLATVIVCYHANKLGKAQDKVRKELAELLPHVAPEEKPRANPADHAQDVLPVAVQEASIDGKDNRTFVRFGDDSTPSSSAPKAVEVLRDGAVILERKAG